MWVSVDRSTVCASQIHCRLTVSTEFLFDLCLYTTPHARCQRAVELSSVRCGGKGLMLANARLRHGRASVTSFALVAPPTATEMYCLPLTM
jgi:hypothetical protein